MAEQDFFEFSAKFDVEIEKSTMSQASKVLDDFYKKYSNRKMKIDTSDMVKTAQSGITTIQKLYKQGIDETAKGNASWWQIEDGLDDQFNVARASMEKFFKDAKIMFSDGSVFSALDENLTDVFSDKFQKGITVVAADLGERFEYLNQHIEDVVKGLRDIDAVRINWNGKTFGFDSDDMSESQLERRIELIRDLMESQKELEVFSGRKFTQDSSLTGMTTQSLNYHIETLEETLNKIREYNDQVEEQYRLTTQQFARRQELINDARDRTWFSGDQEDAIKQVDDDYVYEQSLSHLRNYIESKEQLIDTLRKNESELFRVDGIEEYIGTIQANIQQYQSYITELENAKKGVSDIPVGTNVDFTEVVGQLKEIKDAIVAIREAFEPLTNAMSADDNALHKMLTTSIDDLTTFEAKLNEVYQMINTISNKQFNVTNVLSNGNNAQADIDQIRQLRKEAKETYKQVEELYNESFETGEKLKGTAEGFGSFLDFSNAMSEFDLSDLAKRIKSRSATSLGVVIDELNEWKKVLLQFNTLRNNVEAGSFNVSKYSDTSSRVSVGSKTTDKDDTTIADNSVVDNDDILNKVKSLSDQIQSELTSIRTKMEETFNFDTIELKADHITSFISNIYQQFEDLKTKISALNLEIPAVVAQVNTEAPATGDVAKESADSIGEENNKLKETKISATEAAEAKDAFTEANKKLGSGARKSADDIQEESDEMDELIQKRKEMAQQASANYQNASQSNIGDVVKLNGLTQADFENYANEIAKSKGLKVGDISVSMGENGNMMVASVQMLNEELAQSITYTYKLMELEEGVTEAYLTGYRAKGNQNKALKIAAAAQKKADADRLKADRERAKNNKWLIEQQSKLDTQERRYKHSAKSVDGSTALMSTETSLAADADRTIDSLTNHIRERIKSAVGGNLTDALKEEILNDIRILQNEIAVAQNDQYSATNMKASNVETNKKVYAEYLKAFTANAKKSNVFDQMQSDIHELGQELARVSDSDSMDKFIDKLRVARTKLQAEKAKYAQESQEDKATEQNYNKLIQLQNKLHNAKTQLAKVDAGSARGQKLTREIEAMQEEYDTSVKLLDNEEQRLELRKRQAQLNKELKTAQEQPQTNYGKTIYNREARYSGVIDGYEKSFADIGLSDDLTAKLEKYKAALKELKDLRDKFASDPAAFNDDALKTQFQGAAIEVEKLRKEILGIFKDSQKLASISDQDLLGVSKIDTDKYQSARAAMIDFAASVTNGQFKLEGFNAAGTEMYGTLDKGAGVVQKVTVALDEGTSSLYAYQSGTKQAYSSWQQLGKSLMDGAKHLAVMYLGFTDIIRYVRQGLGYVKEIDLALTELKKVTDETDETYRRFLKNASETASVIGSTVSDFTDATAAFARLGYTIDESSKMAETAIVYKNVADGLDSVEESTESIISTMMAYGIEANDTMSIIDKFNAVGKLYCPDWITIYDQVDNYIG